MTLALGFPKEPAGEKRFALTPAAAKKWCDMGVTVHFEKGAGVLAGFTDKALSGAGATASTAAAIYKSCDVIVKITPPTDARAKAMRSGTWLIAMMDPFQNQSMIELLAGTGANVVAMEMVPRITRAQPMDALSSQTNLAGYAAALLAAYHAGKVLPMMVTSSGTIQPLRALVIGAGVAGLQAIATLRRLGARVEAFDTREAALEQIRSLGAQPVQLSLGETGESKGGYAKALTKDQLKQQQVALEKVCSRMDVVISAALVFGRKAPITVTDGMLSAMPDGGLVIDMAISSGGNVEGSVADAETVIQGVKVLAPSNLASFSTKDASEMYAANVRALLAPWLHENKEELTMDAEDEVQVATRIAGDGKVLSDVLTEAWKKT